MPLTIFAQRMKQAREEKNIMQKNLAVIVGVTPTTISSYEKSDTEGHGKKPTLENAQAIAEALGVSLDWLCGMSDNKNIAAPSYLDFNEKDYFESIVTLLMETSTQFDPKTNKIEFKNKNIAAFADKVNDLIKIYQSGTLPADMLQACIDRCMNDYDDYKLYADRILDPEEMKAARDFVSFGLSVPYDSPGLHSFRFPDRPDGQEITLMVTRDMLFPSENKQADK